MSWKDDLENKVLSITTGDGKIFYPLWKTGNRTKEYNVTDFNFIDVAGTLVERKKPKSGKYPLVFWFEGEDNVQQCTQFDASAADNRPWTINHPLYGTINGQPVSIEFNDEFHNSTQVTVEFWESIAVDYPVSNFSVKDNTYEKNQAVLKSGATSYSAKPVFTAPDVNKMKDANEITSGTMNEQVIGKLTFPDDVYALYQNATAVAQSTANNLIISPLAAINAAQDLMDLPAKIETSINIKLSAFRQVYDKLNQLFESIADKLFFESMGSTAIASYCLSAVSPADGDYVLVSDVEAASTGLLDMYANYLATLDGASVSTYNVGNQYSPDATLQQQLNDLVMFTLGNLYNLGFDSQQERIVYTDRDTNLILLTHRYMGLDASDANIETFRQINGIRLNELLQIKKGRKIKYYV